MKDIDVDEEFATLPDLLRALGYDVTEEAGVGNQLEDYAESYLYHDTYVILMDWMDWSGDDSRESIVLHAEEVGMWQFDFPTTLRKFHEYLDELDRRIGHMRIISEIPPADDENDDEAGLIASIMALIFGVDSERLCDDLGTNWASINDDAVGTNSNPVAYVRWADHLVVGLDDQYVYVFRTDPDGEVLDAYVDGGVIWEAEWPEADEVIDYAGFVRTLRKSAASVGKLPLPRKKTNNPRSVMPIRLLSASGGAFALLPVPDLTAPIRDDGRVCVDVELLSPDRFVRYLARTVTGSFLRELADAWLRCAHEPYPEQSVPTVEDAAAGVAVAVTQSTEFHVTLEILVNPDLESDLPEPDGVGFEVARMSLIGAAHGVKAWLSPPDVEKSSDR